MQSTFTTAGLTGGTLAPIAHGEMPVPAAGSAAQFAQFKVIRRNGAVVPFEPSKVTIAMTKAFLASA